MGDVDGARAWARERCRPIAVGLMQARAERGPYYAVLWHALRIQHHVDADGFRRGYTISDEASMYLYRWAFRLPDAFDIASEIAFANIGGGVELAEGIRHFACTMVGGKHQRPRARGRTRDWIRNRLLLEVLEELVATFDVAPTRNDASDHKDSACDLVSAACSEAGYRLSYKMLKNLWLDRSIRSENELVRRLSATRNEAMPAAFVLQNLPPFPVSE